METITPEIIDFKGTELLVKPVDHVELFTGDGMKIILSEIIRQANDFDADVETPAGRKTIASQAHKVARSKVVLDNIGKKLTSDWKAKAKKVDASRRVARDTLDELKTIIRQPLTDWEDAEKLRVAQHKSRIETVSGYKNLLVEFPDADSAKIIDWIDNVGKIKVDETWEEFQEEGQDTKDTVMTLLTERLHTRQKYEAEQAELAKLREEQVAREKAEYEQRLMDEAAAKAKREAEEKAEVERQELVRREQAAKEAQAKAEREKAEAQDRVRTQEEEAKKASQVAAERAEREKHEAVAEAERKAKAEAVEAEQKRVAKEKLERIQAEKRSADKKHRNKINSEAIADLISFGMDDDDAKNLISHIINGNIMHITINY